MNKLGIVVKQKEKEAIDLAKELMGWLQSRKKEVVVDKQLAGLTNFFQGFPLDEIPALVDLLIVLGGDGTLLKAVRITGDRNVPILGVNLGNLGFLTEITREELYFALEEIFAGKFHLDQRMKLQCQVWRKSKLVEEHSVLNDIVISKGGVARLFNLETYIDESYLTTFRSDGLILSTPTGSTGYTLAATGPIVHPHLASITITPICPHILTSRSVVVPSSSTIKAILKPEEKDLILTLDGQVSVSLRPSDTIIVNESQTSVYLVRSSHRDYYKVLRTKLRWKEADD